MNGYKCKRLDGDLKNETQLWDMFKIHGQEIEHSENVKKIFLFAILSSHHLKKLPNYPNTFFQEQLSLAASLFPFKSVNCSLPEVIF